MRIAFLGLGLIGGSIARALRVAGDPIELAAWTPSGAGPAAGLAAGILDRAAPTPRDALDGAELVVLAAPPRSCSELLTRLGGDLATALVSGATVTDVASTKGMLLRAATAAGVPYAGGHPMAGLETAGFGAADADLFRGRPWVITEAVHGGDAGPVERLAVACGALPVRLAADEHDRLVAAISHLPLVASVALVEAVAGTGARARDDWAAASSLAAGGWLGMTRLARGDVAMGADIAVTNAAALAARLRDLRERLGEWIMLLETPGGPDPDELERRLRATRDRLTDGT